MPTANERKALWFLAFVALSGSGVRLWRSNALAASPSESAALTRQLGRVDSVRARRNRPPAKSPIPVTQDEPPASPVDLDRASAEAIESLPGIGGSLASRIVANRDSAGTFGQLAALCDVRGVGPALIEKLRPLVTFTGTRRPLSDACGGASKKRMKSRGPRTREPR